MHFLFLCLFDFQEHKRSKSILVIHVAYPNLFDRGVVVLVVVVVVFEDQLN